MSRIWTIKMIALYVGALIVGALASQYIPGDMMTKFFITFPVLLLVMIGSVYFLNKQAKSKEGK